MTTCTVLTIGTLDSGVETTDSDPDGKAMIGLVASDLGGTIIEKLVITVVVTTTAEKPIPEVEFTIGVLTV